MIQIAAAILLVKILCRLPECIFRYIEHRFFIGIVKYENLTLTQKLKNGIKLWGFDGRGDLALMEFTGDDRKGYMVCCVLVPAWLVDVLSLRKRRTVWG